MPKNNRLFSSNKCSLVFPTLGPDPKEGSYNKLYLRTTFFSYAVNARREAAPTALTALSSSVWIATESSPQVLAGVARHARVLKKKFTTPMKTKYRLQFNVEPEPRVGVSKSRPRF